MIKLFIDVWPNGSGLIASELSEEYVKKLIAHTEVEINDSFDGNDVVSILLLDAADNLKEDMNFHEIDARVGLAHSCSRNYAGWRLIIDAKNVSGSINPLVGKYFSWDRIESQNIMSFNELIVV